MLLFLQRYVAKAKLTLYGKASLTLDDAKQPVVSQAYGKGEFISYW